jgi:hypothetical protein
MITRTYHIEFLTPCFCAGAEQTRAELRPSAIRGQLRWWFRCLGGSAAEERTIFGGVHGDNPAASTFTIRVRQQPAGGQGDWHTKIPQQGVEPRAYLLGFFCGRTGRLNAKGALAPGSRAVFDVIIKRPPTQRLEQALRVFFSIGALGFRATRAAGALTSDEHSLTEAGWNTLASELRNNGFEVALERNSFADWVQLIRSSGELLKNKLRGRDGLGISAGRNGSNPNVLGSAEPRQASVLHLRPVRIDGRLRLALIEAPHARILGQPARRAHANRGVIVALAKQRRLIGP